MSPSYRGRQSCFLNVLTKSFKYKPIQGHSMTHTLDMMPQPPVFKEAFIQRYQALLKDSYDTFVTYSSAFPRRAIRVNTLKIQVHELVARLCNDWHLDPVPWCDTAFWITHKGNEQRRDIGNLVEHALGYIYIQEPSSMIPPLVLDAQPNEVILDMCASPGSKTTQIAQMMNNTGLIVANEIQASRLAALSMNVQRMGIHTVICNRMDGGSVRDMQFDRILVDAPCSGTGTISKSPGTALMWNPKMITKLAKMQLRLLNNAYRLLREGGTLVYSTCTLEPEEDEGVISAFVDMHPDMELIPIHLDGLVSSTPIQQFNGVDYHKDISCCLRIWPQDNNTEGFFIAKLIRRPSTPV